MNIQVLLLLIMGNSNRKMIYNWTLTISPQFTLIKQLIEKKTKLQL